MSGLNLPPQRLIIIFLMALALALLFMGRAETLFIERARDIVTAYATPMLEFASRPVDAVRGVVERTGSYTDLVEENNRLRHLNDELRGAEQEAQRLKVLVARLEALLNVQADPEITYATGRVVSDTGGPFVDTVITNVGRLAGAKTGQAVVNGDGLVGRVVSIGDEASRILLLTDLNSRIPVAIEPDFSKAILAGDNTLMPVLQFLPREAKVSVGDRVVTSGDGGLMPAGLPVGRVVETRDGNWRIETFARKDNLEFIRVLNYSFPRDIDPNSASPLQRVPDDGPEAGGEPDESTDNEAGAGTPSVARLGEERQ